MTQDSRSLFDDISERGSITAADVLRMRRSFYHDGTISGLEAERLIELNDVCAVRDPAWAEFYIEALTDFTVHQALPQGYVTADNANWLIDRISRDGVVNSETELELLVKVLEEARWLPPSLAKFALEQVKTAIMAGTGRLRDGRSLQAGVVCAADVDLARRILYACGGDGNISVTRVEAEVLFDINDITSEAENDPSWSDLFVKAVANHLMAAYGHKAPSREDALMVHEWLEAEPVGTFGFMGKMVSGGLGAIWASYREQSPEQRAMERLEQQRLEIIVAERITPAEAAWVAERIGRDGVMHANEEALLAFIRAEAPELDQALQQLMETAA